MIPTDGDSFLAPLPGIGILVLKRVSWGLLVVAAQNVTEVCAAVPELLMNAVATQPDPPAVLGARTEEQSFMSDGCPCIIRQQF